MEKDGVETTKTKNTKDQHLQEEKTLNLFCPCTSRVWKGCVKMGNPVTLKRQFKKAGLTSICKTLQRTLRSLMLSLKKKKKLSVKCWNGPH